MQDNSQILECRNLVKRYGATPALGGVSFSLPRGKIIGLLGPNGSGKTTLIKLAAGLLTPTSGELLVAGMKPSQSTKSIVSYLPERTYFASWMRVRDLIAYFSDFYADFDTQRAMSMFSSLGINTDMRLKTMSKGTKEKVQLVMVMSRKAQLYLLDEPIGGVDPAARDYILNTIISNYDENATVLISTHLITDIENVLDEFLFINQGQVFMQDSVDNIRQKYGKSVDALFREVFRC
ncbi:MAG: ABC transporter ATP-binding protein [Acutalibacteraceae bacterium]